MDVSSMVSGSDPLTHIFTGIAIVILLYIAMGTAEYMYKSFMAMWRDRVELFPNTYVSGNKMFTALQNPYNPDAKTVNFSENQRSGIEFSYSMFIKIESQTFHKNEKKLYHILHKGYSQMYPLMGPGIFCWGDRNCLRIYMNCYDTWDNWTDIDNIPVDRWFHLVVECRGNTLYIYLNGNLKQKIKLAGDTPPYQNYGDVYAFSTRKMTLYKNQTDSLARDPDFVDTGVDSVTPQTSLSFDGPIKGMISRVYYFSYGLSYSEIQALMKEGPSGKISIGALDTTMSSYLADTWWSTDGTRM
ncbi:MAG: hypothetical protein EBU66_10745 [Bacteroidetes bacterium]|nr:hypothetical protein [bacterium]NBP65117.1 hypothetical protein [Bacteroidota bacterium]